MDADTLSIGGFQFQRDGQRMVLRTPAGVSETGGRGFLAGVSHLLTMGLDLEGEAELDGGLVFRVEGERVRLRLGAYSEYFRTADIAEFFQRLTSPPAAGS
jgi:hypothetical protein